MCDVYNVIIIVNYLEYCIYLVRCTFKHLSGNLIDFESKGLNIISECQMVTQFNGLLHRCIKLKHCNL